MSYFHNLQPPANPPTTHKKRLFLNFRVQTHPGGEKPQMVVGVAFLEYAPPPNLLLCFPALLPIYFCVATTARLPPNLFLCDPALVPNLFLCDPTHNQFLCVPALRPINLCVFLPSDQFISVFPFLGIPRVLV